MPNSIHKMLVKSGGDFDKVSHYPMNSTGSFRINVKSKMAFMGINFHENWIFGVVLGCLHWEILIL